MTEGVPEALRGCQLKTRRAQRHLDTLREELAAFEYDRPYRITGEFEPDASEYVFYLQPDQDRAIEWGVIAGDLFHNLRSALDHLVYALAAINKPSPTGTGFPIFVRERRAHAKDRAYRPDGRAMIRHVPPTCRPFFEMYQPYKRTDRPDWHILEVLRVLSNEDKHRLVPVAAASVFATGLQGVGILPVRDVARVIDFDVRLGEPLVGKTEVARAKIVAKGPDPKMDLAEKFAYFISLDYPTEPSLHKRDMFAVFEAAGRYVADIIATFEPVFSGGNPVLVGRP